MYVDLDVPIDESLPEMLKEDMKVLEKAYKENDVGTYYLNMDAVEVGLRACLVSKRISPDVFHKMYRKFGWG